MRHKASKQTTINEILAARSFASGTVNDGVVRFRNRARETGGGVARYSNFNGLKLQTYISLRVQRKGIFGAVTNRQTTFPLGRHSAGRPNTLAHAGRDQGLDSGLEGGRACPQFNASSDKNAAKTSFGLKRFSGSVRTAPPANARSPPPRMRADARYASRLNLTKKTSGRCRRNRRKGRTYAKTQYTRHSFRTTPFCRLFVAALYSS